MRAPATASCAAKKQQNSKAATKKPNDNINNSHMSIWPVGCPIATSRTLWLPHCNRNSQQIENFFCSGRENPPRPCPGYANILSKQLTNISNDVALRKPFSASKNICSICCYSARAMIRLSPLANIQILFNTFVSERYTFRIFIQYSGEGANSKLQVNCF